MFSWYHRTLPIFISISFKVCCSPFPSNPIHLPSLASPISTAPHDFHSLLVKISMEAFILLKKFLSLRFTSVNVLLSNSIPISIFYSSTCFCSIGVDSCLLWTIWKRSYNRSFEFCVWLFFQVIFIRCTYCGISDL